MKIHFLRNATLIIETGEDHILLDPMLGPVGSLPPLAFLRHKPRRNPLVPLPPDSNVKLGKITTALITHCRRGHYDHLDKAGAQLLTQRQIPTYCNELDGAYLQKRGIDVRPLRANEAHPFLNGRITPFPTQHGYGRIGKLMGPGFGYLIELPDEPTLYLSGDTVLTPIVKQVLHDHQPDIAVVAAGSASLDIGKPILMPLNEIISFCQLASGHVIANHMEALNHCPATRAQLNDALQTNNLNEKVWIPTNGDSHRFQKK